MVLMQDADSRFFAALSSMAGISKIFKNKDDEDGVIMPEPKARDDSALDEKKLKGDKKKKRSLFGGSKSQPANSSTSFATANGAPAVPSDDLTPAAKLARQHTLRTKADEARKAAAAAARVARQLPPEAAYGDESTVRTSESAPAAGEVDDVDQVAAQLSQFSLAAEDTPNVSVDPEQYGDASEGMEDEDQYRSDEADSMEEDRSDDEGEYVWGRSYRDRHAIPARGILKSKSDQLFFFISTSDNANTHFGLCL
ncbi:hypothetical protein QFC22_003971 [Naganishia vaughanmartiniae]|uniref:Uncharacterized protein n=1 Tax=Naganishia vaughanmartiniae TaxID=1424756 RepID=A0ACC2X402_9TREE|nr:hypothetical protein QFC22_003971 [Naganishia vaughanmartiniae]